MPRRHRSARVREGTALTPERPLVTPGWAQVEGFTVRAVSGERAKSYICPGCNQQLRSGTPHLVVVPEGNMDDRRHWHASCWRRELKIRRP